MDILYNLLRSVRILPLSEFYCISISFVYADWSRRY